MGNIAEKVKFTYESVEDIVKALKERDFQIDMFNISDFGRLIREIKSSEPGEKQISFGGVSPSITDHLSGIANKTATMTIPAKIQKDLEPDIYWIYPVSNINGVVKQLATITEVDASVYFENIFGFKIKNLPGITNKTATMTNAILIE